jgi:hypothetical protein
MLSVDDREALERLGLTPLLTSKLNIIGLKPVISIWGKTLDTRKLSFQSAWQVNRLAGRQSDIENKIHRLMAFEK